MRQKTFEIRSFRSGLDTRREPISTAAGGMSVLSNAHINIGGEIEKRLAFSKIDGTFDARTKGLEVTEAGIVTFAGHTTTTTVPTGVTVIVLEHPCVKMGVLYDENKHELEDILFSCNYNGKAFCAARFVDGTIALYYDGELVSQSAVGIVKADLTSGASIATEIAEQINTLEGWTATVSGATITVTSPAADAFEFVISVVSDNGQIAIVKRDSGNRDTATDGTSAWAGFKIVYSAGATVEVAVVDLTGAEEDVDLTHGAVVHATDAAATAIALRDRINAYTSIHGFYARVGTVSTADVFVYAPREDGDKYNSTDGTTNGFTLEVSGTGTIGVANTPPSEMIVSVEPPAPSKTWRDHHDTLIFGVSVKAVVVSGVSPYTYKWEVVETDANVAIHDETEKTAIIRRRMNEGTKWAGKFTLTVTDSNSPTPLVEVVEFTVTFNYKSAWLY